MFFAKRPSFELIFHAVINCFWNPKYFFHILHHLSFILKKICPDIFFPCRNLRFKKKCHLSHSATRVVLRSLTRLCSDLSLASLSKINFSQVFSVGIFCFSSIFPGGDDHSRILLKQVPPTFSSRHKCVIS